MAAKIVPLRTQLTREGAEAIIRECIADTSRLGWTDHATEQMDDRGIVDSQVLAVLEKGAVKTGPDFSEEHGDWVCVLRKVVAGKVVHAVVGIDAEKRCTTVITAY
ncbi:MAG TPA: DUF4258 domain-containing protein [Rhizomicrobium sp.]|jgi:hypothetical protein|nr:DUF4258 domain-containing protein [Rhizomicrobium sp.]